MKKLRSLLLNTEIERYFFLENKRIQNSLLSKGARLQKSFQHKSFRRAFGQSDAVHIAQKHIVPKFSKQASTQNTEEFKKRTERGFSRALPGPGSLLDFSTSTVCHSFCSSRSSEVRSCAMHAAAVHQEREKEAAF